MNHNKSSCSSSFSVNEYLTDGQKNTLSKYLSWARRNSIEKSFSILLNTSQTLQNLAGLINFLHLIDENLETLEFWSQASLAAKHLLKISEALRYDPSILIEPSLPYEKPADLQLRGSLQINYLLALVLSKPVNVTQSYKCCFNRLLLWLLVESFARSLIGNHLDKLIADISTQMRLSVIGVGDVHRLIPQIYYNHEDYESVSRLISILSGKLLKSKLEPQAQKLLKNIIKVASGAHSPFDKNVANGSSVIDVKFEPEEPNIKDVLDVNHFDDDDNLTTIIGGDDVENLFSVPVDDKQPFELQKLSAGSVLLSTIEQSQFLPWTWGVLNQYEIESLQNITTELAVSKEQEQQLSSVFIWMAIKLGRSIRRILDMRISTTPQSEWILNVSQMQLQRLPPRRRNSWLPSDKTSAWIKPYSEINVIEIPKQYQNIILACFATNDKADYIWQLWSSISNHDSLKLIGRLIENKLPRYTHGKLTNVLPNLLFQKAMDYKFAKMAASHPLTGLPPACAYASWSNSMPLTFEIAEFDKKTDLNTEVVLFGALLNPIESHLVDEIKLATHKIESIWEKQDLIEYHNHYSAYVFLMLIAATGARPINDLFEAITQFDFSQHMVFIDDKSVSGGNKGRLVPLPRMLSAYINTHYRAHLRLVAQILSVSNSVLSQEISNIVNGYASERLPFLFLLSTDELGGWKSISPTEIKALQIFDTALPLNLFRHRLAKILARDQVDSEIIDGLLGHFEYGSESYGDLSERVWIDDVNLIRSNIESAFNGLHFHFFEHHPTLVIKNKIPNFLQKEDVIFGSRARAVARQQRTKHTIRVIRAEINTFLNGRTFDQLEGKELLALSEKIAVSPTGIPRHDALLRYHYFERAIEKFLKKTGKKVEIQKRFIAHVANSPFTIDAPNAISKIKGLRETFYQIVESIDLKKANVQECALLTILTLLFENKLTDLHKLKQIASGEHFRILHIKNQFYMEYFPLDKAIARNQPVQRYLISPLLVNLLLNLKKLSKKNQYDFTGKLPSSLLPLLSELISQNNTDDCLDAMFVIAEIVTLMNQVAVMTMPGIVAAYLAGRTESWSVSLYDFVKLHTGQSVIIEDESDLSRDFEVINLNENVSILGQSAVPFDRVVAHEFMRAILMLINQINDNPSLVRSRSEFAHLLDKVLNQYQAKISTSLQVFGLWIRHLIEGHKRNKKEAYATSSILRYFNALAHKFESIAYEFNLLGMDEDEVTEFYRQLLLSTSQTARHYVELRLYDFHRWAVQEFSLEEPDWSELPISTKNINVRSGIILENEYQQALLLLSQSINLHQHYSRALAFFLILVFRYGLRSLEALGLQRQDICNYEGAAVLLVQNNSIRELKSKQSRRQIPLLFKLSPIEKQLCSSYLAFQEASFGIKADAPLFFIQQRHLNKSERQHLKSHVLQILKHVTGNSLTNIHHARHTAANRISYHLHSLKLPIWQSAEFSVISQAKEILLGTSQTTTRRSSWASARYMGHATRATQYKSYVHYLDEWANQFHNPLKIEVNVAHGNQIVSLNNLPQQAKLSTALLMDSEPKVIAAKTNDLLKALRLITNGKSIESTSSIMCVEINVIASLNDFIRHISTALRAVNANSNDGLSVLAKISASGLKRLFDLTIMQDHNHAKNDRDQQQVTISIQEIKTMIGTNGQILMYQNAHFELVRALLDYFSIPNNLFKVIKSNKTDDRFNDVAHQYQFKLLSQADLGKSGDYQLDSTWDSNHQYHVEARCAFAFDKNSSSPVRNRYELLILFSLFVIMQQQSLPKP